MSFKRQGQHFVHKDGHAYLPILLAPPGANLHLLLHKTVTCDLFKSKERILARRSSLVTRHRLCRNPLTCNLSFVSMVAVNFIV
jgi:hypothetical protein